MAARIPSTAKRRAVVTSDSHFGDSFIVHLAALWTRASWLEVEKSISTKPKCPKNLQQSNLQGLEVSDTLLCEFPGLLNKVVFDAAHFSRGKGLHPIDTAFA